VLHTRVHIALLNQCFPEVCAQLIVTLLLYALNIHSPSFPCTVLYRLLSHAATPARFHNLGIYCHGDFSFHSLLDCSLKANFTVNMRRVLTHRLSAGAGAARTLHSRSPLALRMPSSSSQTSKIATRRLHATAQQLRPAAATAYTPSTSEDYPTSHAKIQDVKDTPYFIDNQFRQSETTQFIELHDPATNNLVTRVPQSTDAELKAAVESAKKAFPGWAATSVMARQQIMFKFTSLIRENWDRLAASITLEQGKTFAGSFSTPEFWLSIY